MRDYAKLSPIFWVRGSGARLRGNPIAQVVAMYLSTCPAANMVGIFYVSTATIAHDTGLDPEQVLAALQAIEQAGYAAYDAEAGMVWIPNHAGFEIGPTMSTGDKRRKKVLAELNQAGVHRFVTAFLDRYGDAFCIRRTPTPEDISKPLPGLDPKPDGASADLEQIRSDPDRSDPIRAGQGDARPGFVRLDLELEPDAERVWEQRTFTKSAGKPIADVWANFVGHFAGQDLLSREAVLGRWSKWVDKQCDIATKERIAEQDRKERFSRPRAPPEEPKVTPAQDLAALKTLREHLAKRKGAA